MPAFALVVGGAPVPVEELDPRTAPSPIAIADSPGTTRGLVDEILPCGLRLVAVHDRSLPVAAVILALDLGKRDDPPAIPGLVHALAHHLLQGNRRLGPLGAAAAAHDAGGVSFLSVADTQIRFESLVPAIVLAETLEIEAQRLRAPTVSPALWSSTLAMLARESRQTGSELAEVVELVHDAGRGPTPANADVLRSLSPAAVGDHLARLMRYSSATLIVVGAQAPADVRKWVVEAVADLPAGSHRYPELASQGPATAPRRVTSPHVARPVLAWPLLPDNRHRAWAAALCRGLARQSPGPTEPKKTRIRCWITDDPRRPTLWIEAGAADPRPLIGARLARLTVGSDVELLRRAAGEIAADQALVEHAPLERARRLALASALPRSVTDTTAASVLASAEIQAVFDVARAVLVVPRPGGK